VPKITSFSGVFRKYKAIKIIFAHIISLVYIIFIIIIRMTCLGHFIIFSQILYFRLSYTLALRVPDLLLLYQLWTNVIHIRFRKISNTIWQHDLSHIGPGIIGRTPNQPETQSSDDINRRMIAGTVWKRIMYFFFLSYTSDK